MVGRDKLTKVDVVEIHGLFKDAKASAQILMKDDAKFLK
jgi:hypothetical protein